MRGYKISPDVIEEIQLDYVWKCLLIKLDVLGMVRTSLDDYSKVLKHIHNIESLDLLSNDMGKRFTALYLQEIAILQFICFHSHL